MSRLPPSISEAAQMVRVRAVLDALQLRAGLDEAVGVLRCWRGCGVVQARAQLHTHHDHEPGGADATPNLGGIGAGDSAGLDAGVGVEAARVVAVVNAAANRFADPDLEC